MELRVRELFTGSTIARKRETHASGIVDTNCNKANMLINYFEANKIIFAVPRKRRGAANLNDRDAKRKKQARLASTDAQLLLNVSPPTLRAASP